VLLVYADLYACSLHVPEVRRGTEAVHSREGRTERSPASRAGGAASPH
jgi:hypothetical protein